MECDLLIDLGESPQSAVKGSENDLLGPLDSSLNTLSRIGVGSNAISNSSQAPDLLTEPRSQHIPRERSAPPFGCPVMKLKAQSVDSLSMADFNCLGVLPLLGSHLAPRKPKSADQEQLVGQDSSSLLSPFASPRPRSTPSLTTGSLLDAEPSKLLSPFGWTPTRHDHLSMNEAIQVEDVPIGHLVQFQEKPEPTLPGDPFDIDTLGRKQSENTKVQQNVKLPPTVQVLLPSLSSIGSEDMTSSDTLNRGFVESITDESITFPTPDDSVFEEAQGLSKLFQNMAKKVPSTTEDTIEDEDGSIIYDCPDWKEESLESDCRKSNPVEAIQETLHMFSKGKNCYKEGRVDINGIYQKSSSTTDDILMTSPELECKSISFASISTISPSPLSSNKVENMKLKARSFIGDNFHVGSLKLRASSCSSMPSSKPGPLKALVPLGQVMKCNGSTPDSLSVHRSFETPHLQIMDSPVESVNASRRMSSTPKPAPKLHTPDNSISGKNKLNHGSSFKKPVINKPNKSEQSGNGIVKKSPGTSTAPQRPSNLGKLPEHQKGRASEGASAKSSSAHLTPALKKLSVGSPTTEKLTLSGGRKHNPSPLLQRKFSNSPSVMKTPTRSISTGSLTKTSSLKKMYSTPQIPSLQSNGRSSSLSSKLPLCHTSRPLAEACVNSPAKHGSPLHKLVSKFRRNLGPKEMKENVHPM